jgi:nucleoside-diphosphate-sugar epimerase
MPGRAFITGATGFVGGHLVERLRADGWAVRALVRPTSDVTRLASLGVERVVGSFDEPEALARGLEGADTVFHLASTNFGRTEEEYRRTNVEGTRLLVRAIETAAAPPRRLVNVSSYAACGPAPSGRPRGLGDPPQPLTAYGRTKLEGEGIALGAVAAGVEVVVVRAPAVYGPGDRALLPFFSMVRRGVAVLPSGGERRVQMIFAEDLARALVRAAHAAPGTYAVAAPDDHSWSDLVDAVAAAVDRRPVRISLPPTLVRLGARVAQTFGGWAGMAVTFNREKAEELLARSWICDLTGAEVLLPAAEAVPLREGMTRTMRWYETQGWL